MNALHKEKKEFEEEREKIEDEIKEMKEREAEIEEQIAELVSSNRDLLMKKKHIQTSIEKQLNEVIELLHIAEIKDEDEIANRYINHIRNEEYEMLSYKEFSEECKEILDEIERITTYHRNSISGKPRKSMMEIEESQNTDLTNTQKSIKANKKEEYQFGRTFFDILKEIQDVFGTNTVTIEYDEEEEEIEQPKQKQTKKKQTKPKKKAKKTTKKKQTKKKTNKKKGKKANDMSEESEDEVLQSEEISNESSSDSEENSNESSHEMSEDEMNPSEEIEKKIIIKRIRKENPMHKELQQIITQKQNQINQIKSTINLKIIPHYLKVTLEYADKMKVMNDAIDRKDQCKAHLESVKKQRFDKFMNALTEISFKLKEMYHLITQGGVAELELVDTLNPFTEGVVFSVRPPKKAWKNITNLSGGEKTLSSLALIFALHHYKPTPIYVMDEIDAALDFRNVSIIAHYLKERTKNAQFTIISLRPEMFELADRLMGVYKIDDVSCSLAFDPNLYHL